MGRKSAYIVHCPVCGKFGTLRLDNDRYLKVRHYGRKYHRGKIKNGMFSHYIGIIGSHRVLKLLADLPDDYVKVFENTINQLHEALSPRQKSNANTELHRIRQLTDLVNSLKEIEELARKKHTRATSTKCPYCDGALFSGMRTDGTFFITKDLVRSI